MKLLQQKKIIICSIKYDWIFYSFPKLGLSFISFYLYPHSSQDFYKIYSKRCISPHLEWTSNITIKCLVIPQILVPLLHQWANLACWIRIITHMIYSRVRPLRSFLPLQPT